MLESILSSVNKAFNHIRQNTQNQNFAVRYPFLAYWIEGGILKALADMF